MTISVAAVDLGASSGRVVVGRVGPDTLEIETVARFPNGPVTRPDGLHWDLPALLDHSLAGLRAAGPVASIGVDSWAIDYGLLRGGELLGLPWSYRDGRTAAGVEAVHASIGPDELYRRTGLQFLPFNTIYQLAAERQLAEAEQLLLVPDLVTYWLTGRAVCERTNASTTGLLDVHTREWEPELLALVGVEPAQLPELVDPGTVVGRSRGHAGGHGRLARHRVGGGRRTDDRPGRGVRLLRHLGSGRRRARPAGGHRGGARRQLHQRGRRRRPGPVPHQRDGHLAAVGDAARVGYRRSGEPARAGGGVPRR